MLRRILFALAALGALSGCESMPAPIQTQMDEVKSLFKGGGEKDLAEGIRQYEEGQYRGAQKSLLAALDAGLVAKSDRIKAHKYLAFSYCVTDRERQCREEFRSILDIDPRFDLSPAEAGHPLWGPVFRSVKAERQ